MSISLYSEALEPCLERLREVLASKLRDNDASDKEAEFRKCVNETEDLLVVCDAKVAASLVLLDGISIYCYNDLGIFRKSLEHPDLAVGFKTGEYS